MGQKSIRHGLVVKNFSLEDDYDDYVSLWKKHGYDAPDKDVLSKFGIKVCNSKDEMIAAGFLYETGCSMCMFEWFIVNPESQREVRNIALDLLLEKIIECAKIAKYRFIYTATSSNPFVKKLKNAGFSVSTEKKQLHMFCEV